MNAGVDLATVAAREGITWSGALTGLFADIVAEGYGTWTRPQHLVLTPTGRLLADQIGSEVLARGDPA